MNLRISKAFGLNSEPRIKMVLLFRESTFMSKGGEIHEYVIDESLQITEVRCF